MGEVDPDAVAAVRSFNRWWTGRIGVLDATLLDTSFSLTEARVLFELNQVAEGDRVPVAALLATLGVDAGYLSRLLKRLARRGVLTVEADTGDRRRRWAGLTSAGREAAGELDRRSREQVAAMLHALPHAEIGKVVAAMGRVREALGDDGARASQDQAAKGAHRYDAGPGGDDVDRPVDTHAREVTLRGLEAGDLGWMVGRHGEVYAAEYGWDTSFEALVARIVADFAADHDPARERAWIAEVGGRRAGCLLCVRKDDETAQLRILLVEPEMRGLGVGSALVRACLDFARAAGYRRMVLWTNDVLTTARRIYEREGFTLVEEAWHESFGHRLVGQVWGREL